MKGVLLGSFSLHRRMNNGLCIVYHSERSEESEFSDYRAFRFFAALRMACIIILTFIITSCDLFSTRTPEPPDLGATFIWTPASTPGILLDNFKGTLEVLDASNYVKCFLGINDTAVSGDKTPFSFKPRPGLDAASQSIFLQWTIQSEQNFLTKLKSSLVASPRLTATFTNTITDQSNSNAATITSDYLILLPIQSNSSIPASISGHLIFNVVLVTTEQATKEWRIVTWTDDFISSSGTANTFTDLKVQLHS